MRCCRVESRKDIAEVSNNRRTQADSGINEMERRRPVLGGAAEAGVTEELSFLSKLSASRGPFGPQPYWTDPLL